MGYAYLPDGTRIDYKKYIKEHPHWQKVRQARFQFDNGVCGICHRDLRSDRFETHHLNYNNLGNEHLRDVITLCSACHTRFHNAWRKSDFWKGREIGHWETFDMQMTASICAEVYERDKFICKDANAPNLCNNDVCRQIVDDYLRDHNILRPPMLDPHDISLFVRNKRYEMVFDAEKRGLTVEQFLDEAYGIKERGKNPLRQEAGKKGGTFDHTFKSFHAHYKENKNINLLMAAVKEILGGK